MVLLVVPEDIKFSEDSSLLSLEDERILKSFNNVYKMLLTLQSQIMKYIIVSSRKLR